MRSFVQTSSIIRNLQLLGFALAVLFLADFIGTYWTSRAQVRGLQSVYDFNRLYDLSVRSDESLISALDALQKIPTTRKPQDSIAIYKTNLENAERFMDQAIQIKPQDPALVALLNEARQAMSDMGSSVERSRSASLSREELVISRQFGLEANEALMKVQLRLKRDSDRAFAEVFDQRNRPVFTGVILGLLFFLLFFLVGYPLIRSLSQSMNHLLKATDVIADGVLDYEAPILRKDEFGRITHAFNRMVFNLKAKEHDERIHAEQELRRLQFLSRTSEELSQSLNYEETLNKVAQVAVPDLADWCAVDVLSPDGTVIRTAIAHSDPEKLPDLEKLSKYTPKSLSALGIPAQVLKENRTIFTPVVTPEIVDANAIDAEHAEILKNLGFISGICVPIRVRGKPIGALSLVAAGSHPQYTETDRIIAEDLARKASYAIDNARLFSDTEAAVHARDEFMSIASHELRTPLTPLKLQLQGIGRILEKNHGQVAPERMSRMIEMSDRMVNRLSSLVDDLLDISRINAGRLVLRIEEFDFVEMIRDVLERFHSEIKSAGSSVSLRAPESVRGTWDRSRVEQVVINLLTNALRYGRSAPIEVSVEKTGDEVKLVMKDQGIGIAEKDQARIFERFERASPTAHYGGLGLGLYITSQIVELHHGKISVLSREKQGAAFTVTLPLHVHTGSSEQPKKAV